MTQQKMKPLNALSKTVNRFEMVEPLCRNRDPNMTQNEHVCVIGRRPEVDDDVISGQNVTTIKGYIAVDFEVASKSSFPYLQTKSFRDGGGGSDGHRR